MLPLEGDRLPWVFLKTPFEERQGTCSPDGRWVANTSNESGSVEIYVRPFAGPDGSGAATAAAGKWEVSTAGGICSRWRRDGKELFYIGPTGTMMAVLVTVTGVMLAPGAPIALIEHWNPEAQK